MTQSPRPPEPPAADARAAANRALAATLVGVTLLVLGAAVGVAVLVVHGPW